MAEIYLIMNKPKGYVCSAASDSHKTVYQLLTPDLQELVKNAKRGHRLHTIGRLDADTTGLLLLTTDGMFSHRIAASRPSTSSGTPGSTGSTGSTQDAGVPELVEGPYKKAHITKTYIAKLEYEVSHAQQTQYITRASQGLTLSPEKKAPEQQAAPAVIHFITPEICEITVSEGKFHEVRRIFKALGNEVTALERIAIGKLKLPEDIKSGDYKIVSKEFFDIYF